MPYGLFYAKSLLLFVGLQGAKMISRFSGSNYKAFSSFDLELKPITILLGANSSGKSALINSLLMLSQSADASVISESPLRLNGSKTGMGETLNIIKDKDPANKLTFTFELEDKETLKKQISDAKSICMENHDTVVRYLMFMVGNAITGAVKSKVESFNKIAKKIEDVSIDKPNGSSTRSQRLKQFPELYTKLIKCYRSILVDATKTRNMPSEFVAISEKSSLQKIDDCFSSFLSVSTNRITPTKISYTFSYNKRLERLQVSEYVLYNRLNSVIISVKKDGNNIQVFSEAINQAAISRSRSEIIKLITFDSLEISTSRETPTYGFGSFAFFKGSVSPFATLIGQFIRTTSKHLLSNFAGLQINHVSPLRAFPQRYYLLDKSVNHRKLNALDGTELAEVLKNNPKIKDNINLLFATYNIGIDVEKVNDIIYKIVVNQDSVNLELTDVGFGISQVLPILVQAYLSPKSSLTIIEQPEIHLHPNMQAWLTDALINIALNEGKKFLIETHSDALIRRVRLRIVDDSSKLSEDDVRIYHLHKDRQNKCTLLDKIEINDNGDIKWPKDFMDVEIKDTIQIQQLKYEKIKKDISQDASSGEIVND